MYRPPERRQYTVAYPDLRVLTEEPIPGFVIIDPILPLRALKIFTRQIAKDMTYKSVVAQS